MKKIIALLMSATLLTGCSLTQQETTQSEELPKIAIVMDEMEDGNAYLVQAYDEFMSLASEGDFEYTAVEMSDTYTWTTGTMDLCEQGYDLIIGMGWQYEQAFPLIAQDYSDVKFVVVDVAVDDDHVKGYTFDVIEGCYIWGVMVATALPDEDVFGYIGNYNDEPNGEYLSGYAQGVLSVNPDAKFVVDYANTYSETDGAYDLAIKQAEQGIAFTMASISSSSNEGVFEASLDLANNGVILYSSGIGEDQTTSENQYILGGLTKDTGVPVNLAIEQFLDGTLTMENEVITLVDGGFGVTFVNGTECSYRNQDIMTDEVIKAGQDKFDAIQSGQLNLEIDGFSIDEHLFS